MERVKDSEIIAIRAGTWWKNPNNLSLDQKIIKETIKNLNIERCPICKGDVSHEDNFGNSLVQNSRTQQSYCPTENYILQLEAHIYTDNGKGTLLNYSIYTNSKNSRLVAQSGRLADLNEHFILV